MEWKLSFYSKLTQFIAVQKTVCHDDEGWMKRKEGTILIENIYLILRIYVVVHVFDILMLVLYFIGKIANMEIVVVLVYKALIIKIQFFQRVSTL